MQTTGFSKTVLRSLDKLNSLQQKRLLAFIESMASQKQTTKTDLLKFAGAFDNDELELMKTAITSGCENIDQNEW